MSSEQVSGEIGKQILGLILLVILSMSFVVYFTPLSNNISSWVSQVLNLGANQANYTIDQEKATTAIASVHALMFSVNKVAWYDTAIYNNIGLEDEISKSIKEMSKEFKGTTAVPIYNQREEIEIGDKKKEDVLLLLTTKAIDCLRIYEDRQRENSGCFTLDFTGFKGKISEDDFFRFADSYRKSQDCDKECRDVLDDLLGKKAFSWVKKYRFNLEGDKVISEKDSVKICAQKPVGKNGSGTSYFIYITDSDLDASKICQLPEGQMDYGMKVKNFELPQDLPANTGIVDYAKKWTGSYGDPEYIVYYEVFPDGEDSYWLPSAYAVDIQTIFKVEGFFFMIDMLPYIGRPISMALEKTGAKVFIKEGMEKITQKIIGKTGLTLVKGTIEAAKEFFSGFKEKMAGVKEWMQKILKVEGKEIAQKVLEREVAREEGQRIFAMALKESGIEEARHAALRAQFDTWFTLFAKESSASGEALLANGRFTQKFLEGFEPKLKTMIRSWGGEISDAGAESLAKKTIRLMSVSTLSLKKNPIARLMRNAHNAKDALSNKMGFGVTALEIDDFVESVSAKSKFLKGLSASDIRRFSSDADKIIEYSLELQNVDQAFVKSILGDGFTGDLSKLTEKELADLLDSRFEQSLKDVSKKGFYTGKLQAMLGKFAGNKRHWITALVVYSNKLEDSMGEKFMPVGQNAIGFRTPFMSTVIFDDELTMNMDYKNSKQDYGEYFQYYEGYIDGKIDDNYLKYDGLLPEVDRYYLSLIKDKDLLFEQPSQRLHLASPCKADLIITKTVCECWGKPRKDTTGSSGLPPLVASIFEHKGVYQTGQFNEYYGREIESFDGESEMLYTIGGNGELVKECYPKGISGLEDLGDAAEYLPWTTTIYKPSCIEINPVLDPDTEINYCYHGSNDALKVADVGLNYGLPIAGALLCAGTGPIGASACNAAGGIIGSITYGFISVGHQWPSHD